MERRDPIIRIVAWVVFGISVTLAVAYIRQQDWSGTAFLLGTAGLMMMTATGTRGERLWSVRSAVTVVFGVVMLAGALHWFDLPS